MTTVPVTLRFTTEVAITEHLNLVFLGPLKEQKKAARSLYREIQAIRARESSDEKIPLAEVEAFYDRVESLMLAMLHQAKVDGQVVTDDGWRQQVADAGHLSGPGGVALFTEHCFHEWAPDAAESADGPSGHPDGRGSGSDE